MIRQEVCLNGIWNVMSSQLAVSIVREVLDAGKSVDEAAKKLVSTARINGSVDDITVLIIK